MWHQKGGSCRDDAACRKLGSCCVHRRWLLGLLVLQSMSSFVLDSYQDLLREHLVVTLFLTMLVGAGGNAGNQSAIKVIRGLVRLHGTTGLHTSSSLPRGWHCAMSP